MQREEDIIGHDFQGWPFFKLNLKEMLIALGGKEEGDNISFKTDNPLLDVYPVVYEDDGMGYYIDGSFIVYVGVSEDGKRITLQKERPKSC